MQPTRVQRAMYGLKSDGLYGVQQMRARQPYQAYKSKYGPNYTIPKAKLGHFTLGTVSRVAPIGAAFGVSAGIFALFFFDGIPRVQKDILQKIPFVGEFFVNEIPPEDNPF